MLEVSQGSAVTKTRLQDDKGGFSMGSLNKIMLIGNVGKDPELRYSKTGDAFTTFSLATSYNYKPADGERQEQTEWHRVVAWRQLAEQAGKYVKKGRKVYVEGRVQSRQYTDNNNLPKTAYEIVATQIEFLDSPKDAVPGNGGSEMPSRGTHVSKSKFSSDEDNMLADLDDLPF